MGLRQVLVSVWQDRKTFSKVRPAARDWAAAQTLLSLRGLL